MVMKFPVVLITVMAVAAMLFTTCKLNNNNNKTEEKEHLVGAYTEQRAPSAEELALFAAAMDGRTDLIPETVATQVVAGINYKFHCKTPSGYCWVTIYRNLQGETKVTSIE